MALEVRRNTREQRNDSKVSKGSRVNEVVDDTEHRMVPLGRPLFPTKDMKRVHEEHVKEAFDQMDYLSKGYLGVTELRYMLTVLGEEPTDEEMDEMISMLDESGDGRVSYERFVRLFNPSSAVLQEMLSQRPEADKTPRRGKDQAEDDLSPDEKKRLARLLASVSGFQHAKRANEMEEQRRQGLPRAKSRMQNEAFAKPKRQGTQY
eukprot:TRINITY_DN54199_c0_g1_i1.p1 TRINITY_DN54199_c0_g1~~TRINITY_DN54199_c0_g1_i1.p1  ORF type:complete len:206 (+),score=41.65 TRINITY_DN54199_c0_g1_i1:83-700(+)